MSLLRAYEKIGVDVSKYYDPDNILDLKRKQIQEEWLDNTPIDNSVLILVHPFIFCLYLGFR